MIPQKDWNFSMYEFLIRCYLNAHIRMVVNTNYVGELNEFEKRNAYKFPDLQWIVSLLTNRSKNGVDVSKVKELEGRFQLHDKENSLIIPKTNINDAGNYTCSIPELKLSADIQAIGECELSAQCNMQS